MRPLPWAVPLTGRAGLAFARPYPQPRLSCSWTGALRLSCPQTGVPRLSRPWTGALRPFHLGLERLVRAALGLDCLFENIHDGDFEF